ncbi:mitochondrial inner membrane protease subunit 1-like [Zophobas morio]|uniref:mitochondrial inner membrane protease subunit 1-like n=1 Tax=Zophobas morio TaxID=2755281 RepID=UPI0030830E09
MCQGLSMLPTLNERGDIVIVDHISPRWRGYQVGDIVLLSSPVGSHSNKNICKRITAKQNDIVRNTKGKFQEVKIPSGHVWIEGDNPYNSRDSRAFGPVPLGLVKGRVVARIWPLSKFTLL